MEPTSRDQQLGGINSESESTPATPHASSRKSKAEKEEKLYDKQKESRQTTIHRIFKFTLWLIFIAVGAVAVIRVYHYLTPTWMRWLTPQQLVAIDGMLSTGVIGALIARYGETMNDMMNKSKIE